MVTLGSDRHRQDYLITIGLLQPYIDGKKVPKEIEELALKRIRQLSAHEIGHTLGFNHNFAASPKDRASVMDYPFPKFSLKADGTLDISEFLHRRNRKLGQTFGSGPIANLKKGLTKMPNWIRS